MQVLPSSVHGRCMQVVNMSVSGHEVPGCRQSSPSRDVAHSTLSPGCVWPVRAADCTWRALSMLAAAYACCLLGCCWAARKPPLLPPLMMTVARLTHQLQLSQGSLRRLRNLTASLLVGRAAGPDMHQLVHCGSCTPGCFVRVDERPLLVCLQRREHVPRSHECLHDADGLWMMHAHPPNDHTFGEGRSSQRCVEEARVLSLPGEAFAKWWGNCGCFKGQLRLLQERGMTRTIGAAS